MVSILPYLLGSNLPPSPRVVQGIYQSVFEKGLQDGSLRPLVLPYHLYGFLLLIVYLSISHVRRPWLYKARWVVLAVIWWWQWRVLRRATSTSAATGYAAGLISVWGMVWSATWLVWCRPQFDAKRVARTGKDGHQNGTVRSTDASDYRGQGSREHYLHVETQNGAAYGNTNGIGAVKHRALANGHAKVDDHGAAATNGHANEISVLKSRATENSTSDWMYYWQSYPFNLRERIPWVVDLILNFRGPGWTWAISPLPPLPLSVQPALSEPADEASTSGISSIGIRQFATRREIARVLICRYIAGYFALDVLKVILNKDPYFLVGPNNYALPPHLASLSPFLLQLFRMTLNATVIIIALEMVFMMAPIGFCVILGPSILGLQGEPWMYSSSWGSFSNITRKGLNGLWGSWWHQVFRFAFSAPTNYFIANGFFKPRSQMAKISALIFAFGISGALHAGGSTSTIPKTYRREPPVFFALQGVGIFLQTLFCSALHPYIQHLPSFVRQVGNLAFTVAWLFYTGHFLLDDFARGGMWLWEPIPISPLRGLGFGNEDDGWWAWPTCSDGSSLCWEMFGVGWYTGKHWWESGVAI